MCRCFLLSLALLAVVVPVMAEEKPASKVEFKVYGPYFEKNTSGLKGDASHLALTDAKAFEAVLGFGFTMGKKPDLLPKDAFDKHLALVVIRRGMAITEYKVEKVTADGTTLTIHYDAQEKGVPGMTQFASPLVVAVERGKFKNVVFVENGKKVATAEIGK